MSDRGSNPDANIGMNADSFEEAVSPQGNDGSVNSFFDGLENFTWLQ